MRARRSGRKSDRHAPRASATAIRGAEFYHAKWADVNLDARQSHFPKRKTGAAMDIPLAPAVVEGFRELHTLAGSSACVLPAHSRSRAARRGRAATPT